MQREELPGHRALAGEEPAPTLVRYRPAGGGPDRVSQVSAVPVRDAQGELLYVIIHFRDVTDEPVFAAEAARRARERLALPRGEAHVGAARLALQQRTDRPRLLGPRPALRARQQRARRDQRAPVRGSPGTDVRRGRPAPRAGARVDRPARARDERAGDCARDGRGDAKRSHGAAVLADELLPGARPRRRRARRRRRDRGGDRPAARRAANRVAARRDADPVGCGRRRHRRHAGAGDRLRGARLGRRLLLAARSGRAAGDVGARGCSRRRLSRDDAADAALAGPATGTRGRVGRSRVARSTSRLRPSRAPRSRRPRASRPASGSRS